MLQIEKKNLREFLESALDANKKFRLFVSENLYDDKMNEVTIKDVYKTLREGFSIYVNFTDGLGHECLCYTNNLVRCIDGSIVFYNGVKNSLEFAKVLLDNVIPKLNTPVVSKDEINSVIISINTPRTIEESDECSLGYILKCNSDDATFIDVSFGMFRGKSLQTFGKVVEKEMFEELETVDEFTPLMIRYLNSFKTNKLRERHFHFIDTVDEKSVHYGQRVVIRATSQEDAWNELIDLAAKLHNKKFTLDEIKKLYS